MATQRRKATGSASPGPQTTDRSPSLASVAASGAASSAVSSASSDLSARSKRQWPTRESQVRVLAKRRAQHRDSDLAGLDPAFEQSASGSLTVGSAAMSHYRFMDGVTNGLVQDQLEGCTEWDVCRNRAGAGGTPSAVEPEAGTGNLKFEQGIVQQNQEHDDVSYLEHPLVPLFATTRWVRVREGRWGRVGGRDWAEREPHWRRSSPLSPPATCRRRRRRHRHRHRRRHHISHSPLATKICHPSNP